MINEFWKLFDTKVRHEQRRVKCNSVLGKFLQRTMYQRSSSNFQQVRSALVPTSSLAL